MLQAVEIGPAPPVIAAAPSPAPARGSLGARALALVRAHGALAGLLAVSAFLRSFHLDEWAGQLIGDECWYVQDARVILGLPLSNFKNLPAHPLSGLDPNSEHPPLAKLIMAGFMKLLGPTEIAWRIPSVILGTLGIWLIYAIARQLGGSKRVAFFAAFVLAFDNLAFIQGRIGMLDIYLMTFILLGTWLYFRADYELAGLAFAVAALCKINGLLGLFAVLAYDAAVGFRSAWRGSWRASWPGLRPSWAALRPRLSATFFCVAFFLVALGALDNYWTEFHTPFEHITHMVLYHASLTHHGQPTGNESNAMAWWLDQGAFDYFQWTWNQGGKTVRIIFRAALNEYVIWAAPLALLYAGALAWRNGSKLGAFAVASFLANFVPPFLAWAIHSRTSYIFYMVPSIPAFACAIALAAEETPRLMQWGYAALVLYAFFFDFPFRYF
ncbi:MAG: glycosyltransferase family 39 protein [Myxococcales bacterium]